MSLWTETLRSAALGEYDRVQRLLAIELPCFLREPLAIRDDRISSYQGPAVKAVLSYLNHLNADEAQMAKSRIDDFIDFVADEVIAKIERTVRLAIFCVAHPSKGITEVSETFDGWGGLKRG